MPIWQRNNTYI